MARKTKKVATLLIVSTGNSLSSQLMKITGDVYNTYRFEVFENGDFLKHKSSGKCFIVMSKSYFDNLNKGALKHELDGYRFRFNLSAIKRSDSLRGQQKTKTLRVVQVTYEGGDVITTSMAAHLTNKEIKDYFKVGRKFNIGSVTDKIRAVKSVVILK